MIGEQPKGFSTVAALSADHAISEDPAYFETEPEVIRSDPVFHIWETRLRFFEGCPPLANNV
jgi:hypothetical protein